MSCNAVRYWYLEDIVAEDVTLVTLATASAHAAGEIMTWIPSWDGSSGDAVWKDVRVDQILARFGCMYIDLVIRLDLIL